MVGCRRPDARYRLERSGDPAVVGMPGPGRLRKGVKKLILDLNPICNYNVITKS